MTIKITPTSGPEWKGKASELVKLWSDWHINELKKAGFTLYGDKGEVYEETLNSFLATFEVQDSTEEEIQRSMLESIRAQDSNEGKSISPKNCPHCSEADTYAGQKHYTDCPYSTP